MTYTQGDLKKAIESFNMAAEINDTCLYCHNFLGIIYTETGRLKLAEEQYLKALSMEKNSQPVLNNYGSLLMILGRVDEARMMLEQVIDLNAQNLEALFNLAYVYNNSGNKQKALEMLKKIQKLHPDDSYVNYLLEHPDIPMKGP